MIDQRIFARHSADRCITYKRVDDEEIRIGYYFPANMEQGKSYPAIFLIHGGGWSFHMIFSDQEQWSGDYLGFLGRYYADHEFVAVSIDYRLMKGEGQEPGYGIENCYEDCYDAVKYVLDHAKENGIDLERMYLLGESAGGYLAAALVTLSRGSRKSFKSLFKRVFLINPIIDLKDPKWGRFIKDEEKEALSPLYHVEKELSRTLLFHGEDDITVDIEHSKAFYVKLQKIGVSSEIHIMEKTKHAFLLAEYYPTTDACEKTIAILDKELGI